MMVLYPSFNMVGTDTLRFSSSQPNGQNISKKKSFNLRHGFGPGPGREWWAFDAKGIEDRLPAYKSKQQELIDIFEKAGEPPYYGSNHILRFSTIYPDLWEQAVKKVGLNKAAAFVKEEYADTWYRWCKNGGFAIQYGAVDKANGQGTADRAFHKPGAHALLKQRFSALEKLNRGYVEMANRVGYVETFPDRTIDPERGYPLVCTMTDRGRVLETVPLSYVIQGSAMHWTTKAMVRGQGLIVDWRHDNFYCWMPLQVHDEIVLDMPKRADPRVNKAKSNLGRARAFAREMAKGGDDYGIPTPVSINYHPESYDIGFTFSMGA